MPQLNLDADAVETLITLADENGQHHISAELREVIRWVPGDAQGMTVEDLDDDEPMPQVGDIVEVDGATWQVDSVHEVSWVLRCLTASPMRA